MKVTQLRLAGQGAWPELTVDQFAPELNVFFGHPRTGKSTVAQLASQLLFGKSDSGWRRQFGQSTPLAEGSVEVEGPQGRYLLRRHRDGSSHGRLSIAAIGGPAVDGGTIRALLCGLSPRLVSDLYAVDFAQPPLTTTLFGGEFAREFTHALSHVWKESTGVGPLGSSPVGSAPPVDRRRVEELVCRRDEVVRQIEEQMSARRRESGALHEELQAIEATIADRRRQADELRIKHNAVETKLAEIDKQLRYFSLESSLRCGLELDAEKHRQQLERLDVEIARCREMLGDLQSREAVVRCELAEVRPDGTADGSAALVDQRATVGVLERLLDDLDVEVAQLARSHEPGRAVGGDAHARLSPVAQLLRQQLYALCGQVAEQERAVRRAQLGVEARQLARAQTDLSEQLEHLLQRRQAHVHATQLNRRPAAFWPQPPAAIHCQCHGHAEFVSHIDALLPGHGNQARQEETLRSRRAELELELRELRTACDAFAQESERLEARWQSLQRNRTQPSTRTTLNELQAQLQQLEADVERALHGVPLSLSISSESAIPRRRPWKASDALAQLTDSRLVQIRANREGQSASIVDREGRIIRLSDLSPAQQDQLHLALTLALTSSLGARGIDLPLFLDEPFLRQDPHSAATMAGVLHEFAREGRQVILFTEDRDAVRHFELLGDKVHDIAQLRRDGNRLQPQVALPQVAVAAAAEPGPATVRIVRETVGEQKPQFRVAGGWNHDEDQREAFFLTTDASIADFPVLGNDTAKTFAKLGVAAVDDLLAADGADVAEQLGRPAVTADVVRLWQTHMSLMCFVPGVSLNDAQVLAANEIASPEALFTVDAPRLAESIERFLATDRGRRFTSLRGRFTRDRLVELQKFARSQRDAWQQARDRYAWVDRPTPAIHREQTAGASPAKPAPHRSKAARRHRAASAPRRFFLDRTSPVVDAPSIGPTAAQRLANVGIRTVADLLNAHPESTAQELSEARLTAATIARWQCEARLACCIPELRATGAQLLAASGFTEPQQIADADLDELVKRVRATCRSPRGERILRNGKAPSREQIAAWAQHAAHMRPLEAA